MVYNEIIVLSDNEEKLFNSLLSIKPNGTDDAVTASGYAEDSTIYVMTATFQNGFFADIKLCSGQSNFFGDSVLFNKNGYEECVLDCFDSLHDGDVFEFESGDDIYKVIINVE